ncbi:enoyl-CoA hydratase [Microtetraspora sp. NBRC 16547]|nr:enoyl-CoA hydratase [Microtetraspora sp. NBRC 16547]
MRDDDWREVAGLLRGLADDGDVRVVVVTGAGGDFCAGADLVVGSDEISPLRRVRLATEVAEALHTLPQPTIAKVQGVAVGAGCNLALGCDFVVASEEARFAQIFVRRGLGLDAGGSWLLPRLVGLRRAKELALLGEMISATEAQEYGLINRVVGADDLDAAVDDLAARLAAGPPIAMAAIKRTLNESVGPPIGTSLALEEYSQSVNLVTEDFSEAVAAFVDRRQPTFRGR